MRIVPALDGGICRIRLAGGEMTAAQARVIAEASRTYGSGAIDATNRANLQIRGVRDDARGALIERLVGAGLGPENAAADDVRNVMLSPLAGIDPSALMDVTAIARNVTSMMQRESRFQSLSPKFALQIDGGERLARLGHSHDLWLSAISGERLAFGFAGWAPVSERDPSAVGSIAREDVTGFVQAVLNAFLDLAAPVQTRMRDVFSTCSVEAFLERISSTVDIARNVNNWRRQPSDPLLRFGVLQQKDADAVSIGAQVPLGRLKADTLTALADLAPRLRMTPWQSVLLLDVMPDDAAAVMKKLEACGLIVDPGLPMARVIACTGSQGCAKSLADTQSDAEQLATLMPFSTDVHLSGCARSCAAAHPIAHTLLATAPGRYDLFNAYAELPVVSSLTIEQAALWLAKSPAHV